MASLLGQWRPATTPGQQSSPAGHIAILGEREAQRELIDSHITELLLQARETERGGIKVHIAAIEAAVNDDLREEWQEYPAERHRHEEVLTNVFNEVGLDTETPGPGRDVVAHHGASLVAAIEMAMANAEPTAAELVAAACVVLAETKDRQISLSSALIDHVSECCRWRHSVFT